MIFVKYMSSMFQCHVNEMRSVVRHIIECMPAWVYACVFVYMCVRRQRDPLHQQQFPPHRRNSRLRSCFVFITSVHRTLVHCVVMCMRLLDLRHLIRSMRNQNRIGSIETQQLKHM